MTMSEMENPGDTRIPDGVDLSVITVKGKPQPVRKVLIIHNEADVDPGEFDEVVYLSGSDIEEE